MGLAVGVGLEFIAWPQYWLKPSASSKTWASYATSSCCHRWWLHVHHVFPTTVNSDPCSAQLLLVRYSVPPVRTVVSIALFISTEAHHSPCPVCQAWTGHGAPQGPKWEISWSYSVSVLEVGCLILHDKSLFTHSLVVLGYNPGPQTC